MVTEIKFSIIIPVYKVEQYLSNCLDSVIRQSYSNWEAILVDDGSPDSCPQICDSFAEKDKRFVVIHKKNGGLSDARNAGLRIAVGDYILFLDSDDEMAKDSLEHFNSYISKQHPDIAVGNLINTDGTRNIEPTNVILGKCYTGEEYYIACKGNLPIASVTPAYKTVFLKENNLSFLVGRYHEDCEFTPRVYLAAKSVLQTDVEHYIRFIRENSITTKPDQRKNVIDMLFIARRIVRYSKSLNNIRVKRLLRNSICMSYLGSFVGADVFQYKGENYKEYIDKKIVFNNVKNIVRKLIFVFSPRLYVYLGKKWRLKNGR